MKTLLEKFDKRNSIELTENESRLFKMLDEMSGRRGVLDFRSFDEDIQEEMLDSWYSILFEGDNGLTVGKKVTDGVHCAEILSEPYTERTMFVKYTHNNVCEIISTKGWYVEL
mgnify:CR=1 FL=1